MVRLPDGLVNFILNTHFENVGKDENWYNYKKKFVALNADAMLNLTNLFCGYKEGRKFEFMFFVGPTLNISNSYSTWNLATKTTEVTNADGSLTLISKNWILLRVILKMIRYVCWLAASLGLGAKYNIEARNGLSTSKLVVQYLLLFFGSVSDAKN